MMRTKTRWVHSYFKGGRTAMWCHADRFRMIMRTVKKYGLENEWKYDGCMIW